MTFKAAKDITVKFTVDMTAFDGAAGAKIKVEEYSGSTNPTNPTDPTDPTGSTQSTEPTTATGTVTLSVKGLSDWNKIYVYSWDSDNKPLLGEWPGSEITKKNGDWVTGAIPANLTNLVISTDGKQTQNLQIDAGKDVWVVVNDTVDGENKHAATVTYTNPGTGSTTPTTDPTQATQGTSNKAADNPAPSGTLSNYRVVGNATWMGNWDPANNAGQMYDVGNGVYKKNFDNVEPGSYELKITKDGKWDVSYGDGTGQNFKFTVTEKCTITVSFAIKDNTPVIEVYGTGVPSTADVSMISVIVLLVLATTATAVLVINKKKFI